MQRLLNAPLREIYTRIISMIGVEIWDQNFVARLLNGFEQCLKVLDTDYDTIDLLTLYYREKLEATKIIAKQLEKNCTILVVGSSEWLETVRTSTCQELDTKNLQYKRGRERIKTNGGTVYFSTSRRLQWLRGMKAHYVHVEPEASNDLKHNAEFFLGSYMRE